MIFAKYMLVNVFTHGSPQIFFEEIFSFGEIENFPQCEPLLGQTKPIS
jgi:hypothetical protein